MTVRHIWLFVYGVALLLVIGCLNLLTADDRQYSRLAESFLDGRLFLTATSVNNWADTAPFEGYHYSVLGPFPAVLIMPLIAAGYFHPGLLSLLLTIAVFYLCVHLATKSNYSFSEAFWFALAFCFATSFIGVAALACSNFVAHQVAVMLLFLALNEYAGKRRPWLIGGLMGLATASRGPTGVNILFFASAMFLGTQKFKKKAVDLAKLLLPFAAAISLLAFYNFARFGTPWESGYSYQINGFGVPYADWNVPGNTAGAVLALSNIWNHLWVFLFGLPDVKAVGISVVLMSPFLICLSSVPLNDVTNRLIIINVVVVLLAVLSFRSTGFEQVGYRFSLDFMPFVFWLWMRSGIRPTARLKTVIIAATVLDLCLTLFFLLSGAQRRLG